MPEKLVPTSIRLPAELKIRLVSLATKRRQPLSLMIVYVLERWYRDEITTFVPRTKPARKVKPKVEDAAT